MTIEIRFGRLVGGERRFGLGLNGLTLWLETPWWDAWAGHRNGVLTHSRI